MRSRQSRIAAVALALIVALPAFGCSVASKQKIMETALDESDRRHEMFEATLRVLDENPKYVDEFFLVARKHPKTMDRFVRQTSEHLDEEALARMTGKHLARHPRSLRLTMIATLDASSDKPDAQQAIAEAIEERAQVAAMTITSRPETVRAGLHALLMEVVKKPAARRAFLAAMAEDKALLAELLVDNPKTAKALAGAGIKAEAKKLLGDDEKPKRDDEK